MLDVLRLRLIRNATVHPLEDHGHIVPVGEGYVDVSLEIIRHFSDKSMSGLEVWFCSSRITHKLNQPTMVSESWLPSLRVRSAVICENGIAHLQGITPLLHLWPILRHIQPTL